MLLFLPRKKNYEGQKLLDDRIGYFGMEFEFAWKIANKKSRRKSEERCLMFTEQGTWHLFVCRSLSSSERPNNQHSGREGTRRERVVAGIPRNNPHMSDQINVARN